jgi:long-subunit acyl-CoA synthetase (AMP-forming)
VLTVLAVLTVLVVLQAAVGGRMRPFISGGAPLPPYAQNFMATAMNVPVLQVSHGEVRLA